MGCIYSTSQRLCFRRSEKAITGDNGTAASSISEDSKIFDVINVDDRGNEINHGQIEITENDLILHQKNKNSIVWPLRSLRRYGFDIQLFSFECGRRCSTGPGIYAFKSEHAEKLFNILQESLQHCNTNPVASNNHINSPQHTASLGNNPLTVVPGSPGTPLSPSPPALASRTPIVPLNPSSSSPTSLTHDGRSYINSPVYENTGVLNGALAGLTGPCGNISRLGETAPNENDSNDLVDYVNIDPHANLYSSTRNSSTVKFNFKTAVIDLTVPTSGKPSTNNNLIGTDECQSSNNQRTSVIYEETETSNFPSDESRESYCHKEIKSIPDNQPTTSLQQPTSSTGHASTPSTTTTHFEFTSSKDPLVSQSTEAVNRMFGPVNYITLDLENSNNHNQPTYVTTAPVTPIQSTPTEGNFFYPRPGDPTTPTSKLEPSQSYATINFDATLALSNSAANHRKF